MPARFRPVVLIDVTKLWWAERNLQNAISEIEGKDWVSERLRRPPGMLRGRHTGEGVLKSNKGIFRIFGVC